MHDSPGVQPAAPPRPRPLILTRMIIVTAPASVATAAAAVVTGAVGAPCVGRACAMSPSSTGDGSTPSHATT